MKKELTPSEPKPANANQRPKARTRKSIKTDALLLTCMDFRMTYSIMRYLVDRGLKNRYDHVAIAGASLGVLTDRFPAWRETFFQHLDLAVKLHSIHTVIVVDHRDCGAYRLIIGNDHAENADTEKDSHSKRLKTLRTKILEKYPNMNVEMLLMALDGQVETII